MALPDITIHTPFGTIRPQTPRTSRVDAAEPAENLVAYAAQSQQAGAPELSGPALDEILTALDKNEQLVVRADAALPANQFYVGLKGQPLMAMMLGEEAQNMLKYAASDQVMFEPIAPGVSAETPAQTAARQPVAFALPYLMPSTVSDRSAPSMRVASPLPYLATDPAVALGDTSVSVGTELAPMQAPAAAAAPSVSAQQAEFYALQGALMKGYMGNDKATMDALGALDGTAGVQADDIIALQKMGLKDLESLRELSAAVKGLKGASVAQDIARDETPPRATVQDARATQLEESRGFMV